MSYSVTIELSPNADPACTVYVMCCDADGNEQHVSYLHETSPKTVVSVPTGQVLKLVHPDANKATRIYPSARKAP